ncbi:MAG: Enhanced entry protein EnhA [uncultured bacterium]|nr:MAG: Enhanced entry protein EnhA [uncultured bacterium]
MIAVIAVALAIFITFFSEASFASIGSSLCKNQSDYNCYVVKRGDTWDKLFPNSQQKDLVMRVNRMNTRLHSGMRIAIPKNLGSADLMDYAPFPRQINPPGEKMILVSVSPSVLAWGAYNAQGVLQNWGPVSGGKGWCADVNRGCGTKAGKFAIYNKGGAGCKSSKFPIPRGGAPMPYCMFFHGGFALHGSYEVPGYNASHGCVRLFISDARWLNQEFSNGSRVIVVVRGRS